MHGAEGARAHPDSQAEAAALHLSAWQSFCAGSNGARPSLMPLPGEAVPQPYHRLLVHNGDMTPALEHFHGGSIHLEILHARQAADHYERHVVLRMDGSHKPVEFGVIEIQLGAVNESARTAILE